MFDNLNESSNNIEKIFFLVVDFIFNSEIQDHFPKITLKLIIHLIVLSCFSDDLLSSLHENLTENFLHYFNSTDFMVILLNEGIIINLKHCKTIKIIDYNIKNFYVFSFQDQNLILSSLYKLVSLHSEIVQWISPMSYHSLLMQSLDTKSIPVIRNSLELFFEITFN